VDTYVPRDHDSGRANSIELGVSGASTIAECITRGCINTYTCFYYQLISNNRILDGIITCVSVYRAALH
jgi:hypothetical protein